MPGASDEDMSLRAYLLGELPPDGQMRIEERLLVDRDYMEILLVIEDELTDSYLRGTLSERERTEFENYFLTTPARRRKLRMAKALRRYVDNQQRLPSTVIRHGMWARVFGQPFLTHAWASAIAAVLVLGVALGVWWLPGRESLADKGRTELRAALKESPIEGRIAGFDWAPKRVTLGEQSNNVADKLSFERAERDLLDAVRARSDSDSHYALGQFYLAKSDLDSAIEQFNQALLGAEKNARVHSDLGAALLERGKASQAKGSDLSLQDFALSLEHLDSALELNDSLLEARFNRALCYEYMQLPAQAETDWRNYLSRDANSPWADEAKRHLNDLEEKKRKTSEENPEAQLKEFLIAFHIDDRESAWKLVSQNRDLLKGRLIWWQLLDDFFKTTDAAAPAVANKSLQALEYVGNLKLHPPAEGQQKSDPYLSELAAFYRLSSPRRRSALAQAHERVNEGNQLLLKGHYEEAIGKYTQAEDTYLRARDQWERMLAKLLIGTSRVQKGDAEQSRPFFDAVAALCKEKGYLWLWAESCYGLGRVHDRLAEHSKSLEYTTEALKLSESIDDGYNAQRSLAQIADQYRKLGNYDLSINSLNRCLDTISKSGWAGARQTFRNCDQLMQLLAAKKLYAAAAAYGEEALRLAPEIEDQRFVYVSASHLGLVRGKQRNYSEAITLTQQGLEAANALPDDRERLGYLAYTALQLGDLYRAAGDFDQALAHYDQAIEQSTSGNTATVVYGAHQGRLRCRIALMNDAAAEAELSDTLGLLEQYRSKILEEQNSNTFFDREQSVYDAAIDFRYSRTGDKEAVFNYLEESRARWLLDLMTKHSGVPDQGRRSGSQFRTLREVQTQLPDQTQLIEYAVLDDKLLICLVSKSEFSVRDVRISVSELANKVSTFRASILRERPEALLQAQELYKLLIKPIELSPENGEQVCIVPDKVLYSMPFVALVSPISGRYIVEDYQVTLAPSATVHLACSERTNHTTDRAHERLLAVGDPSFDQSAFPSLPVLPSTRQQVNKIGEFYRPSPTVLTDNAAREEVVKREMEEADVIHLASHYVVYEGDPMNSRLLLAREPRDGGEHETSAGFLKADEVFALKLRRAPLVVLSACDSGVEHYYNGEGMIGMSRVFIAAGAPVVVASLWQVDAYATDELMVNFHGHRKLDGLSTCEALTRAQREMLKSSKKHPYYWGGFATIGGRTDF